MPRSRRHAVAAAAPGAVSGRLFVVATPIGNLGDITQRALETLRAVHLIAAEDTRHTGKLLSHFSIATRMISYQAHNRAQRLPHLLAALEAGDVALVTDAGTPLVSDPGQELAAAAAERGHAVIPVPGPSAPIAALSVAGLPALPFHFVGFLPRRSSQRRAALRACASWPGAVIVFEAPHRLVAALRDALDVLGDRRVAVCCELTKLYEDVLRATLSAAIAHYQGHPPRGEFTLVIEGATQNADAPPLSQRPGTGGAPDDQVARRDRYQALLAALGDRRRALAALAAETGLPRKQLYAQLVAGRQAPRRSTSA